MKITLNQARTIVTSPEKTKTTDKITILQLIDNPSRKIVTAITAEIGTITLWKGDDYDAIGQWTDVDVIAKIKEIYGDV
jgi:hypothetical protein